MAWPIGFYRVVGESMLPTYRPGDLLLGLRWFRPRPGQVVVARHNDRMYIKRLAALGFDGAILLGDNAADSIDSRQFGPVPARNLKAKIVFQFNR